MVGKNMSFIVGKHPVKEALLAGRSINAVWLADGTSNLGEIAALCKERKIPLKKGDRNRLSELAKTSRHQGVIASVAEAEFVELESLIDAALEKENPLLILLDHLEDPQNLGSLLRSCDGAGADGIIVPKRRQAPLSPVVTKISAGAINHVKISRVANLSDAIKVLQQRGFWVYGLDGAGEIAYTQANFQGPVALVIGNEAEGLKTRVAKSCDHLIKLPMLGHVESLNAAVAGAICLYEVVRQRTNHQ